MLNTRCFINKERHLLYIRHKSYSNQPKKANRYSATVFLPKTDFPLRIKRNKLLERDNLTNKICTAEELYQWQRSPQRMANKGDYVLHDGPPYANGPLHMGHAINKVLKDIVVRSRLLQGFKIHYKPGWDCHGLPIELKAVTSNISDKTSCLEIREAARKFATETIERQMKVFKSWGILGDWHNSYKTYSKSYIKNQLIQFYKLYDKGLIYRDLKPVYWSPESRTALAEAELEYNDKHVSNSITVKLEINNFPQKNYLTEYSKIFALIWTTNPWTLPSNQAIAFNNKLKYSVLQIEKDTFCVLASDLIGSFRERTKLDSCSVMENVEGFNLEGLSYINPLNGQVLPFLASDHVTVDKGTGLVHSAPAHGPEDYLLSLKYNIPIINLVDGNGCYTHEAGPVLKQLPVLGAGNSKVIELLRDNIILIEPLIHAYPYDWRTKTPVILRASQQWFLNTDLIKDAAAKCLDQVNIWPKVNSDIYRRTLMDQLLRRPYWCISRQRSWGVPIPVFYNRHNGLPIVNTDILSRSINLLYSTGSMDFWWQMTEKEILNDLSLDVPLEDIMKGEDIFDIWFDSGMSWTSVLEGNQIADMYLEGLDQFTGWFQSSLITSVCLRNSAPYRSLYVHGHALDEHGTKMSKSKGNVIDPNYIVTEEGKAFGVDTLRWWVASHASRDSSALVTDRVLQSSSDEVQKLRAVLRFIIGALMDYKGSSNDIKANVHVLDKYMLHLLCEYNNDMQNCVAECNFTKVCATTINFLTNQISALYLSAVKDRIYCDKVESLNRLSSQYVLHCILLVLLRNTAAVLPHLSEEVYLYLPATLKNNTNTSFFQQECRLTFDKEIFNWENNALNSFMKLILNIRKDINKNIKDNSTKMDVKINVSKEIAYEVKQHFITIPNAEKQLELLFQVAKVSLNTMTDLADYSLEIKRTDNNFCDRCRRYNIKPSQNDNLCIRCNNVILCNSANNEEIKHYV